MALFFFIKVFLSRPMIFSSYFPPCPAEDRECKTGLVGTLQPGEVNPEHEHIKNTLQSTKLCQ